MRYFPFFCLCFLISCAPQSQPDETEKTPVVDSNVETEAEKEPEVEHPEEPKVNEDSLEAAENGFVFDLPTLYLKLEESNVMYAYRNYGQPKLSDSLSDKQGFQFKIYVVSPISGEGDEGIELIQVSDSSSNLISQLFYYSGSFGDSFMHEIRVSIGDGDGVFLKERLDGTENAELNDDGSIGGRGFYEETEHEYRYGTTGVLTFSGSTEPERNYHD